jgi:ATP-dependent helicase/nuclease subunit A
MSGTGKSETSPPLEGGRWGEGSKRAVATSAHSTSTPPPTPLPQGEGESARQRANAEQRQASDPAVSAFVAASAGSGKTKLLTDRLLRLMLSGEKPERIQCLTFTKAAAAEMAVRLQRRLGQWVTFGDAELDAALSELSVDPTGDSRRRARKLFAQVLDLPGGMRIGTIHAFCQSLLRRFPLEAALSPHFQLVDDRDAADALTEAREDMLAGAHTDAMRDALRTLAGLASAEQFGRHVDALQDGRERLANALALPDLAAAQRRALAVTANSDAEIVANAVNWQAEPGLRTAANIVHRLGAKTVSERAGRMLEWLTLEAEDRAEHWNEWCAEFLTGSGEPRKPGGFVSKKVTDEHPDLAQVFIAEAERILDVIDSCRALAIADLSNALLTLAVPVLRAYATHKQNHGLVDYDDLIGRTSDLLRDPGAAWVLYKLDGGLDHLLLDEVQDTAPEQWKIAHALSAEFFAGAGAGARDVHRTVFAVGDRKQSIYAFQGADVDGFNKSRDLLEHRVTAAGKVFRRTPLDVSFRSTTPVLDLVDAVFADPVAAAGVVEPGETLKHHADRAEYAGAVELWPLTPLPDQPEPQPWEVADANHSQPSAPQRLADTLAEWIAGQTSGGGMLESRGRALMPGDVLVLVRRRNDFARALVRALKTRNVPVAGLDRLVLTEQAAVQDLLALADALLLPQDELNFACLLTSPLGGLSDDDLMALAVGRRGHLFESLRERAHERPHWRRAWDFFATLLARVDYVSPYALFSEALGPLGGRARLYARLGPEAAEPIDELLHAALSYAQMHSPSLQGFLHWLRRSGAEVKREAEAAGNQVRVMTVHGAKGLQAPLVIIPDTTALPPDEGPIIWAEDPQTRAHVPLFSPRKEFRCLAAQRVRDDVARRRMEEHNRLLYVALTRAEDRLVVCGWQTRRGAPDECWYNLVTRGFEKLATETEPFAAWDGEVRRVTSPQRAEVGRTKEIGQGGALSLPNWLGRAPEWRSAPPPPEPLRPGRLAPSRPEGVELGPVPPAASPLADRIGAGDRFQRGLLLHAVLQHLPDLPEAAREDAARRWLDRPGHDLPDGAADTMVAEAMAILRHPELRPLFGPGSRAEVPLTGVIGTQVVGGLVDRLAVLRDQVLVADFKTNRHAPDRVEDTPVMYLRQLAAYRAVLRQIFPDRPVRCALIWTRAARVAMLPDELLDSHDPAVVSPAVPVTPAKAGAQASHAQAAD